MTYQLFKKNNKWHKTYTELGDGKYDETIFVEIPDCIPEYDAHKDYSIKELLDLVERRHLGYVGMYGLKEHYELPSTERKTCSTL